MPVRNRLQDVTSSSGNAASNGARAESGDRVGQRAGGEGALRDGVLGGAEIDVINNHVAGVVRVAGEDGVGSVSEGGALDQDLGVHARVDGAVDEAVVVVVDNVNNAEADRGATGVDVEPVVVGVGDVQGAKILVLVAVGVADERTLPLFTC